MNISTEESLNVRFDLLMVFFLNDAVLLRFSIIFIFMINESKCPVSFKLSIRCARIFFSWRKYNKTYYGKKITSPKEFNYFFAPIFPNDLKRGYSEGARTWRVFRVYQNIPPIFNEQMKKKTTCSLGLELPVWIIFSLTVC